MDFANFLAIVTGKTLSLEAKRGLWMMIETLTDEKKLGEFSDFLAEAERRAYDPKVDDPGNAGIDFATEFFRCANNFRKIRLGEFEFPKNKKPKVKIPKLEKSRRMNGKASKNRGPKKGHPK